LSQQRTYGDLFKSLFDQFRDRLAFASEAAERAVSRGSARQDVLDSKFAVAALYLRWHRIRPVREHTKMTPEAWAKKKASTSTKP